MTYCKKGWNRWINLSFIVLALLACTEYLFRKELFVLVLRYQWNTANTTVFLPTMIGESLSTNSLKFTPL